jgi:hypothetical protein
MSGQIHRPADLPQYEMDRGLSGPRIWSGPYSDRDGTYTDGPWNVANI